MTTQIVRGTTVEIYGAFTDEAGAALTPDEAVLKVRYTKLAGGRETVEVDVDIDGANYTAEWDSSVAKFGKVQYSIKATKAGSPSVQYDGDFMLVANEPNLSITE